MECKRYSGFEFCLEKIAFVEKEDDADVAEELVGDDRAPEEHRVLQPVDSRVLGEGLVERRDGGEEDYGVDCKVCAIISRRVER